MIPINPIKLQGSWDKGWALDIHSISSTLVGYNQYGREVFETKRTPLGEALYKLKSRGDRKVLDSIAETVVNFIKEQKIGQKISALVPVPPNNVNRRLQPTIELIRLIGIKSSIKAYPDYIVRVKDIPQLKNTFDPQKRRDLLKDAYKAKDLSLKNESVLLFDDLYRSGSTLDAIAGILCNEVKVVSLYVVVLTKTRSLR